MKKTISTIISLILVFSCFSALTGCGHEPESSPHALSIVMGVHKNFPKLTFTSDNIENAIYEACYSYGDVSTITVEGRPSQHGDFEIRKPDKSITDTKRKQLARQNASTIINDCMLATATTEETDTFAALQLAADAIQSSSYTDRQLIVIDSGLITTGVLNQNKQDYLSADPGLVTEKLAATHSLPNLKGVNVTWIGLSCVAGEQEAIPDSYKYKNEALWSEIITASGGTVKFDSMPLIGEEAEGLPNVSTVSFAEDLLDIDFTAEDLMDTTIKIDNETVKFQPDSSNFVDLNTAKEALKPIAEMLKNNSELNIVIAGTTASVGDGYELSTERAVACKNVLVSMGADERQIECIGLGCSENCFHVNDLDENGQLIEELAKLNRAIYIFSSTSDTAKQFKDL